MRRGKIVGLKWSDINFDKQFLSVKRSIYKPKGEKSIEKEPKSHSSFRTSIILFAVNSNFLSLMLALMMKLIYDFSFFTWNFFTAKKRIKLGVSHTHFALVGLTIKKCR